MAVRIKLSDGTEMLVEATLDELRKARQYAMERGDVLKIEQPDGRVIAVAPEAVEILAEAPEEQEALAERFAAAHPAGV